MRVLIEPLCLQPESYREHPSIWGSWQHLSLSSAFQLGGIISISLSWSSNKTQQIKLLLPWTLSSSCHARNRVIGFAQNVRSVLFLLLQSSFRFLTFSLSLTLHFPPASHSKCNGWKICNEQTINPPPQV